MRGRFKLKDTRWEAAVDVGQFPSELSPLPGDSTTSSTGPDSPVSGLTDVGHQESPNCPKYGVEKRYLGVRVKMPVKDMLRNIRLAKGWDPQQLQENCRKRSKGEKKRVNTCTEHRTGRKKRPTKSLEELAIIVEVLEEDLKTGNNFRTLHPADTDPSSALLLSSMSPEPQDHPWRATAPPHANPFYYDPERDPTAQSNNRCSAGLGSPSSKGDGEYLPSSHQGTASCHNAEDVDDMIPSPQYLTACSSPGAADYWHALPCPDPRFANIGLPDTTGRALYLDGNVGSEDDEGACLKSECCGSGNNAGQSSSSYFLTQLQREENQLRDVSDAMLLPSDAQGRTALHRVVGLGKRAQGYAIAKRMVAINCLDLKDFKGMTALHLAAKQNQHLMVADLIHLGANVNEKDASGKTCLHLCVENGYIRVLEVLKQVMADGVFVDVAATDNYGLSVLQCAALALSATVRELERSGSPGRARLHTLRKEQMMETMECLLQMDSSAPLQGCAYRKNAFDGACEKDPEQIMHCDYHVQHREGQPCDQGQPCAQDMVDPLKGHLETRQ